MSGAILLTLDTLAKGLNGDIAGGEVLAPGPGHSAADRSMSVRPDASAPDGFVVHSFAGDDPIACRDHVRQKLGLKPFEPSQKKKANGGSDRAWTTISEHVYRDEDGQPYLRVRKCLDGNGRKQYPQAHWSGSGWASGAPDVKILYRLPELVAAPPTATIIIAEGEACVDVLARLGFISTCNSGGADGGKGLKWTSELNRWFAGRHVVLLPDNDEPGRRHVEYVAQQLHGVAASIKTLDLAEHWPGPDPMGVGDDVADFIEQHDRAGSRLARLFKEEAATWTPPDATISAGSDADDKAIAELAKLEPLAYAKRRKLAAEQIGITVGDLDRLVKAARPKPEPEPGEDSKLSGRAIVLVEPEPATEPVEGAALLDDLAAAIGRHVVMTEHARDSVALWVVHSFLTDIFFVSPRLAIRSPMKRCGKTTLLDVLGRLVLRPLPTANVTSAALFRVVEEFRPTLLIDEADSFLKNSDELRGIINSGHRRGGAVLRTSGDDHEVRQFATYGACVIAAIGALPDTIVDRSVVIDLKRRLPSEKIEPFRADRVAHLHQLARRIARWAQDHVIAIGAADPAMPDGIINREADNWRPLLSIADVAGGHWPDRARKAATASREATDGDENRIAVLLGDIKSIFAAPNDERISSADLVKALHEIEGRPWAEFGRNQKLITANQLARLLKPLGIAPGTIRTGPGPKDTAKGYKLGDFSEAFDRYLDLDAPETPADPPEGGSQPSHRHNDDGSKTSGPFQTVTPETDVTVGKCKKPNNDAHCDGVTVAEGENRAPIEKQRWRMEI